MDVLYHGGSEKVTFTCTIPGGKRPLAELSAVAQVVRALDEVRRSPTGELHVRFFFDNGGTSQAVSSIRDVPQFDSLALESCSAISAAAEVWSAFNLGLAPAVAVGELLADRHRLLMMASLLNRCPFRVFEYTVSAAVTPPCRVGAPFTHYCAVGDRVVTVVGALLGDIQGDGPDAEGYYNLRMSNPEPRVFERDCRPATWASFDAKSALRRAVKSVEDMGLECILAEDYQGQEEAGATD